uniref:AAA_12 domain-containing protein n=1 Tax=Caenorhabditis japonica TaxID=281687 RepID=A0A8R1E7U5_CAEJA
MVGVTNSAVTSAVFALQDIDRSRKCKFVRLMSDENRTRIASEYLTQHDYPVKWRSYFTQRVREQDKSNSQLDWDVVDAAVFLRQAGELKIKDLRRRDFRSAIFKRAPEMSRMQLFFHLYRPDLVMGTISSVRMAYSHPGMSNFSSQISLTLVDEASQMPRFAFITLCQSFPTSRLVLFGDIRQLPPFSDSQLPADLHRYAVGNILEDASSYNRFPQLPLFKVHRCPRQITTLLSNTFYEGSLVSDKDSCVFFPELRSLGLPYTHPLVFVNHNFKHKADGTSVINVEEALLAIHFAKGLFRARRHASFAVMSFYKSTAAFVEDNAPEFLQNSTVDGSQGREYDYIFILTSRTSGNQSFLDDPKRINVAISRTKVACLVLGSIDYLRSARTWCQIMKTLSQENFAYNY